MNKTDLTYGRIELSVKFVTEKKILSNALFFHSFIFFILCTLFFVMIAIFEQAGNYFYESAFLKLCFNT